MKKQLMKAATFFGLVVTVCFASKLSANAYTTGELRTENGQQYLYANGQKVINDFVFDGTYTYYAQADGTPMTDRLTYHPDGEHIIYFDESGHEVFSNFQYCPSVGYTCYFDSQGYIYKDQLTFVDGDPYYLNANGKMEQDGWFQFSNGLDYGYAYASGELEHQGFDYDPWGRVVYYHWNGMVARGLITDGNNYYNMSTDDGHYLGHFSTGNPNPVYGPGNYIVGVNIPAGEYFLAHQQYDVAFEICSADGNTVRDDYNTQNLIFTVLNGETLYINEGIATANLASQGIDTSQPALNAKIGVHLGPGVYRITATDVYGTPDGRKGISYFNLWNDSSFLNGVANSCDFSYTGQYVDVRVSAGQMLDVWNAYVTYVGP